jgi:hypothetical protein
MAEEEKNRVLTDVTWILTPASDNDGPPPPGVPALLWRQWMEKQALVWACSRAFHKRCLPPRTDAYRSWP